MFETWQDVVVTAAAFGAAVVVVLRSVGHWHSGVQAPAPKCDGCSLTSREARK